MGQKVGAAASAKALEQQPAWKLEGAGQGATRLPRGSSGRGGAKAKGGGGGREQGGGQSGGRCLGAGSL